MTIVGLFTLCDFFWAVWDENWQPWAKGGKMFGLRSHCETCPLMTDVELWQTKTAWGKILIMWLLLLYDPHLRTNQPEYDMKWLRVHWPLWHFVSAIFISWIKFSEENTMLSLIHPLCIKAKMMEVKQKRRLCDFAAFSEHRSWRVPAFMYFYSIYIAALWFSMHWMNNLTASN